MFSEVDKEQIRSRGISEDQAKSQLNRFEKGFPSLKIISAATTENGILKLDEAEVQNFIKTYTKAERTVLKFVPASGAATRMFKLLYKFIDDFEGTNESLSSSMENEQLRKFFSSISQFAFYKELDSNYLKYSGKTIEREFSVLNHEKVIDFLLNENGLNYGNLPKGLLTFHDYDSFVRTPVQEQLDEGIKYAEKNGEINVHFTVSPNHLTLFKEHVSGSISKLDPRMKIHVSFSSQKESTDTIAATPDFKPFRDDEDRLLFRPAGHGALIENLNELDADIIFIKNIDNVVPDRLKEETVKYKKALAGVLIAYQQKAFALLHKSDAGEDVFQEANDLLKDLGISGDFSNEEIKRFLNRPIRVCGMVKNEGEPGGGPFWVDYGSHESLQIVESAQIDDNDKEQVDVFKSGTHFNPVDLVCGVRNYKGEKFDLLEYRDENTGFISEKSNNGRKLLAMELPGLWNGSMAYWNTIFVEVPLVTFNPVKTVTDLLKPNHR